MADYYVAKTGNDSNPGTLAEPFLTIQAGVDAVTGGGDTVIVQDGTYTDIGHSTFASVRMKTGGSVGNWVTIKSENQHGAVLEGVGQTVNFGFWFDTAAGSYIRIEGFEIYNYLYQGISINQYATCDNLYFYDCKIHTMGTLACTTDGNARTGIASGTSVVTDITVDSCLIYDCGRLRPGESGCGVAELSGYERRDHGIYLRSDNILIKNCVFYDNDNGWDIQIDGGSPPFDNIKIYNNTFADPNPDKGGQIVINRTVTNLHIANNIFSMPTTGAVRVGDGLDTPDATWLIENNLVHGVSQVMDYKLSAMEESSTAVVQNNLVNTDPLFTDAGTRDYTLTSGSPAIDAGLDFAEVPVDYSGVARPLGSSADIGAYEFNVATPSGSTLYPQDITVTLPSSMDEYYVDLDLTTPSGGTGTELDPWTTFNNAQSGIGAAARPLRLNVRGTEDSGTSSPLDWNESGTGAGNEIVISNWPGYSMLHKGRIQINGDYIIFDGRDFTAPGVTFSKSGAASVQEHLCRMRGTNITIWRCKFMGPSGPYAGTDNSCLDFGSSTQTVDALHVVNCVIDGGNSSQKGVYIHSAGTNSIFEANIIRNCKGNSLQVNPRDDRVIDGLIIRFNRIGPAITNDDSPHKMMLITHYNVPITTYNLIIHDNIFFTNPDSHGIDLASGELNSVGGDACRVYNNTIYDVGPGANDYAVRVADTVADNEIKLINNIVWDEDINVHAGATVTTNSNNLNTDPGYVSVVSSSDDFLKLPSAIGGGLDLTSEIGTTDYLGNTRTGTWDIGAIQYTVGAPVPPSTSIAVYRRHIRSLMEG